MSHLGRAAIRMRHLSPFVVSLVMLLAGCGIDGGNANPAGTPQAAVTSATPAPLQVITAIPVRYPDASVGAGTDGWTLDRIEAKTVGTTTTLTITLLPPPDETSVPATSVWFERGALTYVLAIRGVRASNIVVRPNEIISLAAPPLTGYSALPVRDDAAVALAITATRASSPWSLSMGTAPGIIQLTCETR